MVPAVTATGDGRFACCQPVAVSPVNATVESRVPALSHNEPVWAPPLPAPL